MFARRYGHAGVGKDSDRAPIFLQFIDAVWQVTVQYPCSFEFNEHFLIFLMDALFSCEFGTFLMDCPKERIAAKVATTTPSVWSYVNNDSNIRRFLNPLYDQASNLAGDGAIMPNASLRDVQFWRAYYLRYNAMPLVPEPKSATERAHELLIERQQLEAKIERLQQQLAAVAAIQLKKHAKQILDGEVTQSANESAIDNSSSSSGGGSDSEQQQAVRATY
jgi:hypothetical protein